MMLKQGYHNGNRGIVQSRRMKCSDDQAEDVDR